MKLQKKSILLLSVGMALGASFFSFTKSDDRTFQIVKNLDIFNAVFKELDLFYVDTINPEKVIRYGIDAMLSQTDPYTEYYPEEDNTLKELTTGKFGGIGSAIRYYQKRDRVAIVEPVDGMPAAEMGLLPGDIILQIDGKEMVKGDMDIRTYVSKVSEALRGEPGTTLVVKIDRPTLDGKGEIKEFKITRRTIQNPPVPYYGMVKENVGYISLTEFTDNCSKEVKKAVIELKHQGATSLILDLRSNGGGLLGEAVEIVNLFVPKGKEVVVTKGKIKQAESTYKTTNEPIDLEIPLVVMVDGATASAAEIVSGSLQDFDRAVIVGNRTFGKGLVQVPRELPFNSSMKLTTAKYYIPSGRCIQAIDYSKRNPDGTIARIPDSLTTVFRTEAGREVRDGGGIRPDVEVKPERLPNMLFYLMNDDLIFDYAVQYALKHEQIAEVKDFELTDADYAEFKAMVQARNFTYDRQSEKALKSLKELAEFEGYMDEAAAEFEALEKKLIHQVDRDLDYFSDPIKEALSEEIVKRYYYQRGSVIQQLKRDADLEKSIELLNDVATYSATLKPVVAVEASKK
ncbi:MAG: S41 family peptidase [Phocaeicola sp.]